MKLKILIGIFVFIIIVNIAAVDTYLYYHLVGKSAEISGNIPRDIPTLGGGQGDDPLASLNDMQRNKLRDFMEEFRKSTGDLNGRIRILDDKIFNLIQEDSIKGEDIDQYLKEISATRLEISKIAIDKIIGTKLFLSKNQQEQLFSAIFRIKLNVPQPRNANDLPQERKFDDRPNSMPVQPDIPPPPKKNRLKKFSEVLELTKGQVAQVDAILELSQNKYSSLKVSKISDPSEYRIEMKAVMDEEDAQIEKILTDVQKKKFAEMKMKQDKGLSKKGRKEEPPRK